MQPPSYQLASSRYHLALFVLGNYRRLHRMANRYAALFTVAACALSACTGAPTSQIPAGVSPATARSGVQIDNGRFRKKPSLIIVVANGLENPRGLTFGSDGRLY